MTLIRNLPNINTKYRGGWITIGNYDGLHLGHQNIVRKLGFMAHEAGAFSQVLTFEPLPRAFFNKAEQPSRLMNFRTKYKGLMALGVDQVICLKFNEYLATLTPQEFVADILVQALNIKGILVGEDFKFGHQRAGNVDTLKSLAKTYGFKVAVCEDMLSGGQRISSSLIRQALMEDDFETAMRLLGHSFGITARIGHGEKRGRLLGFPTANLVLPSFNLPLRGVYLVEVRLNNKPNEVFDGLINIGIRPTFRGNQAQQAEVHIVNFSEDIYGQKMTVQFISKIRDEQRFKSIEALKSQIQEDMTALQKNTPKANEI